MIWIINARIVRQHNVQNPEKEQTWGKKKKGTILVACDGYKHPILILPNQNVPSPVGEFTAKLHTEFPRQWPTNFCHRYTHPMMLYPKCCQRKSEAVTLSDTIRYQHPFCDSPPQVKLRNHSSED